MIYVDILLKVNIFSKWMFYINVSITKEFEFQN